MTQTIFFENETGCAIVRTRLAGLFAGWLLSRVMKWFRTREDYQSTCPGKNAGVHEGWIGDAQAIWLMGSDEDY
jgi:hypothetical protein